ncbi:hypothetical protein CSV72_07980 [Sporosarcina sp. P20a]|uniref:nucleotidyltransferase n=1 Tax=Sporosarcina sp. P20a TaxID=2048256 RepID=UPI000C1699AE|nr:nucleotidyltransferase [Sporosarcina sp. P20a]PIC86505.1 hypothetical protein CSV72_07980 [Sporosarcina sp. P20a]
MIATGIVVEYNPFHNGHLFHLNEAKRLTGADVIIAVMSGHFLQRGEPAIVDKWTRTRMALASGADLVIELPYAFSTAHAPQFAKGAIQILDALQCKYICFGSEEGHISPFMNSLDTMNTHNELYEKTIKSSMQEGISYPNAMRIAYEEISRTTDEPLADLSEPNNILGFHYMKAIREIQSNMMAVTLERKGTHFHDEALPEDSIASATGIRKELFATDVEHVQFFMPSSSYKLLHQQPHQSWDHLYPFLRFVILREGPEQLASIADITEGIEFSLWRAAKEHTTFQEFMQAVKSKRYTWTRIQRMLVHVLTGYRKSTRAQITSPSYLRLLGMSENGRSYLRTVKKELTLPLVSRAGSHKDPSLLMDIKSTDIYMCGIQREPGLDFKTPPILL